MTPDHNVEEICSITFTEMARKLRLSRLRLYQLIEKGVFPGPAKHQDMKRPFYTPELQRKCLEIRKTGTGFNGRPVIFNTPRKHKNANCCENIELDGNLREFYDELTGILKQMGNKVTRDEVKNAIQAMRPNGLEQFVVDGELIRDLYGYFKNNCKESV